MRLILLPGMLCDGAFWQAQIEGLADICEPRVLSFGSLDNFDAMAEAVLAGAPERFALAGHSMGGRVALEVYRRAPHRVLKLALLATDYRGHLDDDARAAEAARRGAILAKIDGEGMRGFAQMWIEQVVARDNLSDATLIDAIVEMMARHSRAVCAAQTLAGLMRRHQADVLAQIRCPTLVCAGSEDTLRPVAVHRDMAARIAGSRLVVVDRAAHMVAMERPAEVTTAMWAWLSHA